MSATDGGGVQRAPEPKSSVLDGNSVQRVAESLVKQYGNEAAAIALDRADALYDLGNIAGSRAWIRILEVIEGLQRQHTSGNGPTRAR